MKITMRSTLRVMPQTHITSHHHIKPPFHQNEWNQIMMVGNILEVNELVQEPIPHLTLVLRHLHNHLSRRTATLIPSLHFQTERNRNLLLV